MTTRRTAIWGLALAYTGTTAAVWLSGGHPILLAAWVLLYVVASMALVALPKRRKPPIGQQEWKP